jgi:hypothetical protein
MEKINYLQEIPRCSPKVAEELLNLLGAPEVEVSFRSQISDNEIKKIAALSGIINPTVKEVKVVGKVSKERALAFYKQHFESRKEFQIREPFVILEKMKWGKFREYRVEFDGYSINAIFYNDKENLRDLAQKIFEIAKQYKVALSLEYVDRGVENYKFQ